MTRSLEHVVVLGAGTMGSRLAADCANHGVTVTLLDVTSSRAQSGLRAAMEGRPQSLFLPAMATQIRTGGLATDLGEVARADWVVEAIVEDMAAKQELLSRTAELLGAHTVLSTNTSGLPVGALGACLPASIRERWMGTHFFNPPRYMRLAEIIPTPGTDPEALRWMQSTLEVRLGKGVVIAKDTPNFIANRIGVFALLNALRLMEELGLGIEEVDALTGPVLGLPKSATFRTLDMIGLDTLARVVENSHRNLFNDERRELFRLPGYMEEMLRRSWLGDKTGQGFYRRDGDEILTLDPATMTYHPRAKVALRFDRLQAAWEASPFVRRHLEGLFDYCTARVGEICDEPEEINRAMRWGYNWQHGPFEMQAALKSGTMPDRTPRAWMQVNSGCAIGDLGKGVGCLELRGKFGVIGAEATALIVEALQGGRHDFDAWVITSRAENFSAGADLQYLLALVQNEEWDEVAQAVRQFQAMTMAVKRSARPVVLHAFGLTLGGGCELMLHAARVAAHDELYTGLVEAGVGLIPAGGGSKELALRLGSKAAFELIARARVSSSAREAEQMGLLRRGDACIANRDRVLGAAREMARQWADAGYEPPLPATFVAPGPSVASTLEIGALLLREAERISSHDVTIARRLIHVLCAGDAPKDTVVTEEYLLELEAEAFLGLCGETLTQARIAHMLKTGKALRN